jgi:hypothetical protein
MTAFASELSPSSASLEQPEMSAEEQAASQPFVGRWNRLISTTNWEKGAIILQWRETLVAAGGPVTGYSDEAWCRLVGGVTPQHVGRLRRVQQRFGGAQASFAGLYWSHFFAALDWNDAEMWLEGAVQNRWSVSQMRNQRWETLGRVGDPPQQAEEVAAETDEDAPAERDPHTIQGSYDEVPGPRHDGPDFGDEDSPSHSRTGGEEYGSSGSPAEKVELIRPFADLPELPEDLAEAFDGLKLVLLRHKTDGWQSISCEATLAWLDALKSLATAPTSEEAAPF